MIHWLSLIRTENQKEDNLLIIIYVENVGLFHEFDIFMDIGLKPSKLCSIHPTIS